MPRPPAALIALALLAPAAPAASPALTGVLPTGATRGGKAEVLFLGDRLADAQEVLVYRPGITAGKPVVENPQRVKVTLTIAPDCPLGEHAFRLRTASGVSDLRTFWVGTMPIVAEKEPNSAFATPQPIALDVTVSGVVDGEDVDHFVVDCKKGQRLAVEVEGMRLGQQFWDPYVAILDAKRFELAASDDSPVLGQDAGCAITVPADGKYVVLLREASYGGNGACHYRLHVGTFPRPTAVVPAGGRPGEEVAVTFRGDPLGEFTQKIKLPATPGDHRVHAAQGGVHPAGFKVRVADLPGVVGSAAAESPAGAAVGGNPGAFHGVVSGPQAACYFRFAGKKGQTVDVNCFARRLGSPLDPVVHLYQANGPALGGEVAVNDDANNTPDSQFRAALPADGDYYLRVYDHLQKGGPDYFFRLEVTPGVTETVTTLPKVDSNNVANQERQSVAVPRGNRMATVVTVNRANWSGPAALSFPTLPAGVTADADPADASVSQVPVVFTAADAAGPAGALTEARATPADGKTPAAARTELDVNFNMGLNNVPFHRYFADRVAVAAAAPAPFTVDVQEPKLAMPQNGAASLKVTVTRAAGFAGPVTVYPLWMPPGVGLQGSITIDGKATEGVMGANANADAPAKTWRTALIAVADAGQGPVWASTKLFKLTVGPPVLTIAQDRAAVEQGQKTQVVCKLDIKSPPRGPVIVRLMGLPAKAAAADKPVTADTKEVVFDVTTEKDTPAGKHGTFCQVLATADGETVSQGAGGNELRVDVPLPPKAAEAAKPAAPAAAAKPAEKRLTRLEQLRLEQEAREKAAAKKP